MLWAIDVGNTHTVFGFWNGEVWTSVYRFVTAHLGTEDEIAARLRALMPEVPQAPVAIASVNPMVDEDIARFCAEYLGHTPNFLRTGEQVGLTVMYEPPTAVGADRVANALAALALVEPPLVVVDFGTATTFDCLDAEGRYLGGAIMPGPDTLMDSLTSRTAKLPRVPIEIPEAAVGRNTAGALQSGVVLGYLGAVNAMLDKLEDELGPCQYLTTGGLGLVIAETVPRLTRYEPNLTLDGLRLFLTR